MLLDCTVDVSGVRFNDGAGAPAGDPSAVILAGLSLIWGRPTTLDQPQAGTCTFSVADWTGTAGALDTLAVGATVDVNAAGVDYGAPSTGTFDDPEITRLTPITLPAAPGRTVAVALTAAGVSFTAAGASLTYGFWAYFRPDDPSSNPSAWVAIPRMGAGQQWAARITGATPYGALCRLAIAAYRTPGANPAGVFPVSSAPLSGAFDESIAFVPPAQYAGMWAAVALETIAYATWTTLAGTWAAQPQTWRDMATTAATYVDVLAPPPDRTLDVRVFSGRITDVQAAWDAGAGALVTTVTAADFTADLANRRVAAAPWPKEAANLRIGRILTASGATIATTIDPGLTQQIAPQDVDAQAPTALLKDVATSVDAVMWAATSDPTGPYLRFENVSKRPSGLTLELIGGLVYIVPGGVDEALILDACAVIREPVTWRMDTGDVITRVGTRWLEAGVGTDGKPTETDRTEWIVDTVTEGADRGVRSLTVDTQLTSQADATTIGTAVSRRVFGPAWRIDGLTVDDTALADSTAPGGISPAVILAELLDGTRRIGRLTQLENLPSWAPGIYAPATNSLVAYLEGGVYTYTGAAWSLALVTSDARGQGASLRWTDLTPTGWTWAQLAPSVTWRALIGVTL